MTNMTHQQELKLLLKQAQEAVARMGRGESEDPEERADRLLECAATWVSEAGYVSLGYLPVEGLRKELQAQASSDDYLDEFNTDWLRYELTQRIGSDEWQEQSESAVNEMLNAIAKRLLKNARRRRRKQNKTREKKDQNDS